MARTAGYVVATIIAVVLVYPAATLRAKLRDLSTALISHREPDSKQAQKSPQDKLVLNTRLVNLTVSVNDKLGRFVAGLSKEDFEVFDDNIKSTPPTRPSRRSARAGAIRRRS
jgi:hypothetical protein